MKIEQRRWDAVNGWKPAVSATLGKNANLVLLFGGRDLIKNEDTFQEAKKSYPHAQIIGCSTSGEICDTEITDDTLIVTAIEFEKATVKTCSTEIDRMENSFQTGATLAAQLSPEGLVHVFVLSDGLHVNGSDLVRGISSQLPAGVTLTGGLSGDGERFKETYVIANRPGRERTVCLAGFYGKGLIVGYSSMGGWDAFGPERVVTKSRGNVLYELDGKPALDLYKTYLGDEAARLPASGLLFPLSIRHCEEDNWLVRTILAVNEKDCSLTFAGDIPEGVNVRLMKANFEKLILGAKQAAESVSVTTKKTAPELAILISCVGRKMILKGRIEEEAEAVRKTYGSAAALTGFYSYGEISPFTPNAKCELHNQTMTITTFSES